MNDENQPENHPSQPSTPQTTTIVVETPQSNETNTEVVEAASLAVALAEGSAALAKQQAAEIITEAVDQIQAQEVTLQWLAERQEAQHLELIQRMEALENRQALTETVSVAAVETAIQAEATAVETAEILEPTLVTPSSEEILEQPSESDRTSSLETPQETSSSTSGEDPVSVVAVEVVVEPAQQRQRRERRYL